MPSNVIQIQSVGPPFNTIFGSYILNEQIVVTTPVGQVSVVSCGTNTSISVPTGTTSVTIIPPTNNANALTFKGVAGDTGVAMNLTQPSQFSLASSVTTFVINAGAATSITFVWS